MKAIYIAPAVECVKMEAEQVMAGQSGLSGNNQEGDGNQLSKEQEFFDVDSVLNKYVPDVFSNVFPQEE